MLCFPTLLLPPPPFLFAFPSCMHALAGFMQHMAGFPPLPCTANLCSAVLPCLPAGMLWLASQSTWTSGGR